MRKFFGIVFPICMIACFSFAFETFSLGQKNLYESLATKDEVKVYLADITNSSPDTNIDVSAIKSAIENALVTRMTIKFRPVIAKEESDITINCDVKEFIWQKSDPVDLLVGAGGVAMDAFSTDNYGRIQAVFTVSDTKTGNALWANKLKATVTKKSMDEKASLPILNERIVEVFMRECFSKTH